LRHELDAGDPDGEVVGERTMKKQLIGLFVALSLFAASAASAAGLEMDASALPAATRASLAKDISSARAQRPDLFRTVGDTIANAESLDAHARRRGLAFTPHFKALGPNALLPMIEAVAFDARTPSTLSESARSALRVGLLEAIGSIRDDRAVPVLEHVLDHGSDVHIVRAAATALARVGTDASVAVLLRVEEGAYRAESGGARHRAILAGLHDGRRVAIAKRLASRIDGVDDETARVIAKSLGGAANAWAWRAIADKAELVATREESSRALLRAYIARPALREATTKALLVVDDPRTSALIASARTSANADLSPALDELDRRFRDNPARLAP
jgi:hypothetical protein